MEGELTGAAQDIARSDEDWFISYAQGPDVSREEAERLAQLPAADWTTSRAAALQA